MAEKAWNRWKTKDSNKRMTGVAEQLQYYRVGDKVKVPVQVPGNNGEYTEKTVEVTLGSKS